MSYALISKGAVADYPYTFTKLRKDNPGTSFSEDPAIAMRQAADLGVVEVSPSDQPAYDETKNVVEGTPALVNGAWMQVWEQVDASPEVIAQRQTNAADDAARDGVKADTWVKAFVAMTPAEAASYVNTNVTNLASAKDALAKLAFMVNVLARRELRD